jgi:hypothetical protein
MPDGFELHFKLSRQDWLAANAELIEGSDHWARQAHRYRRMNQRMVLALSPLIILGAALLIGRSQGMYIEGAIAGALLAALMFWGLPRIDVITPLKKQALDEVRRADFSNFIGDFAAAVDREGLTVTGPSGHTRTLWQSAAVQTLTDYIFFHFSGSGIIIPIRTLGEPPAAQEFIARVTEWCAQGQRPPHEQVTLYLADRDVACPGCGYNLRGIRGLSCPECSAPLSLDRLVAARQGAIGS